MPARALILIGSSDEAVRLEPIADTLRQWDHTDDVCVHTVTVDRLLDNPACLAGCDAAWVVLDGSPGTRLNELVNLLQECQVPAMISRPDEAGPLGDLFQYGVVIAPPSAPTAALCGVLRTLWNQAGLIRTLKTEVNVLRAHQSGLCEQMDKIDEELRLAAQLQREFLPPDLPSSDRMEFEVLFRPAGYVSGDIYDVCRLDDRHVGLFLADAVGHGVPAALLTMYIKRSLQTKQPDPAVPGGYRIVPPDQAIARLNQDMVKQKTGKVRYATACYAVIDCLTREVCFARAGHPYPMILRADGTTEAIGPDGLILGVFADAQFELARVTLGPDDRMLFYTDGFELAFPSLRHDEDGRLRGRATTRYTEEFKDLANGPLGPALTRLAEKIEQQAGSLNQGDDLTVVGVRVRNEPTQPVVIDNTCAVV